MTECEIPTSCGAECSEEHTYDWDCAQANHDLLRLGRWPFDRSEPLPATTSDPTHLAKTEHDAEVGCDPAEVRVGPVDLGATDHDQPEEMRDE